MTVIYKIHPSCRTCFSWLDIVIYVGLQYVSKTKLNKSSMNFVQCLNSHVSNSLQLHIFL